MYRIPTTSGSRTLFRRILRENENAKEESIEMMEANATTNDEMSNSPSRIIFGSCNSQYYEQPLWKVIEDRSPTAFVWAGDAVYSDDTKREPWVDENAETDETTTRWPWQKQSTPKNISYATPEYLRQVLKQQLEVDGYKQLIQNENISIFGTWDDHDYGINNGDITFPFKSENAVEFTNFLGLDKDSSALANRAEKGMGVYGVQVYDFSNSEKRLLTDDEAGLDPDVVKDKDVPGFDENNQLVAVFVLDVRSFKTPWKKKQSERYSKDAEGDFLGEDQWEWFETALSRSKASVNIVVTGIQAHAPWFYDSNKIENWSGFPKAQHRLYQALLQPNVQAPILVSGDIHFSQLLRKDCLQNSTTLRPLYEVTTSGMTHSWGSKLGYCGRPNKSKLCQFSPFQFLVQVTMRFAHWVSPWKALLKTNDYYKTKQYTLERNVAEFEFDWQTRSVYISVLGEEGQTLLQDNWAMNKLTTINATDTKLESKDFDNGQERLEASLGIGAVQPNEFVCVEYRGNINNFHFGWGVFTTIGFFMLNGILPFAVLAHLLYTAARRLRGKYRKHKARRADEAATVSTGPIRTDSNSISTAPIRTDSM